MLSESTFALVRVVIKMKENLTWLMTLIWASKSNSETTIQFCPAAGQITIVQNEVSDECSIKAVTLEQISLFRSFGWLQGIKRQCSGLHCRFFYLKWFSIKTQKYYLANIEIVNDIMTGAHIDDFQNDVH